MIGVDPYPYPHENVLKQPLTRVKHNISSSELV